MNKYDNHIEAHHILQDAMNIVNKAEKVNNMIISINVKTNEEKETKTYNFTSGCSYGNIGLCISLKHTLLKEYE